MIKKKYYTDLYMLGQILPSAIQPKDINDYDYEFKENKVKILESKYDRESGKFLGIDYCVGMIPMKCFSIMDLTKSYHLDFIHKKKIRFLIAFQQRFLTKT